LVLRDCLVTNAIRCVPPKNRPVSSELAACRRFLSGLPRLVAVLCLGRIAHGALLVALGRRSGPAPFAHGAHHRIGDLEVFDSYHCSRYNTNTGRLTPDMLEAVIGRIRKRIPARMCRLPAWGRGEG
jgi:uracil-DNA glycosylase